MSDIDPQSEKILRVLESKGRLSNIDLAAEVGLSPSACLRRVQALEEAGVIKGYKAIIDRSRLAPVVSVFVMVGLGAQGRKDALAFERAMEAAREVVECHNIAGNAEYLLRVEVSSLEAYKNFHAEVLGVQPQVTQVTSYFRLSTSKDKRNFLEQDIGKA